MPARLTKKIMGFPLWVWIALLAVAVILGLYLRSRRVAQVTEEPNPGDSSAADPYADQLAGNTANPGLAGVLGPASAGVVPVASPEIPQGFSDSFGSLTGSLSDLTGSLANIAATIADKLPSPVGPDTAGVAPAPAAAVVTATGGGAPARPAQAHMPPAPKSAVAGLPKGAGDSVTAQAKWVSIHPEWVQKNQSWVAGHPVMIAYARSLPGNRLPG